MISASRQRTLGVATRATVLGVVMLLTLSGTPAVAADPPNPTLQQTLDRTGSFVAKFLEDFSNMKCTELVSQTKLGKDGKKAYEEDSSYDYLLMTHSPQGELTLVESRLAVKQPKHTRNLPLLVTNGFSTLLMIFHPAYQASFGFTLLGNETVDGKPYAKVHFQHVRGTRSTTALILRGLEYPLNLEGAAWVDPQSGAIAMMSAGLEGSMEDIGLRALHCEVRYAPVALPGLHESYWLPTSATVDVETPRQHWRNTHRFTDYQRFSISTKTKIAGNQ